MTAALPLRRILEKFSAERWMRAIYVGLNNTNVQPLVDDGLLEMRFGERAPRNHAGQLPREYRLTEAGKKALQELRTTGAKLLAE